MLFSKATRPKYYFDQNSALLYTHLSMTGERGNAIEMYRPFVRVYVGHEIIQRPCGRIVDHIAFVLGLFKTPIPLLRSGLKRFVVSRDLDLFIYSAEVTILTRIVFL